MGKSSSSTGIIWKVLIILYAIALIRFIVMKEGMTNKKEGMIASKSGYTPSGCVQQRSLTNESNLFPFDV